MQPEEPSFYDAGPALDARIIVDVLGYVIADSSEQIGEALLHDDERVVFRTTGDWFGRVGWHGRFSPSTDWRAAGMVVERLLEVGFGVALFPGEFGSYAHVVLKVPRAWFEYERARDPLVAWSDLDIEGFSVDPNGVPSLPLALCRASLSAIQRPRL
jgi:hypothetical protein